MRDAGVAINEPEHQEEVYEPEGQQWLPEARMRPGEAINMTLNLLPGGYLKEVNARGSPYGSAGARCVHSYIF